MTLRRTRPGSDTDDASLLDEDVVVTILSRHFPTATGEVLRRAAEDVLLLQMLMRDAGVIWEDAMRNEPDRASSIQALQLEHRRGS